ncbi:MAG: hypothetical protein HY063_06430 [Bacteroidetes bacterium]|nr:hypothetical protein [Bacteroidota bacterium]
MQTLQRCSSADSNSFDKQKLFLPTVLLIGQSRTGRQQKKTSRQTTFSSRTVTHLIGGL